MEIGIIGAGVAGLAMAWEALRQGHRPTVFEQAPFLGGQASTFLVGDQPLERGYHHLFLSDTDILELVDELGLGHKMQWFESSVGVLHQGKLYDFLTPMDLLKFTPVSLAGRIRLGLATLYLQRIKNWQGLEQYRAESWVRKFVGESAYAGFWGPMLRGKFGEYYDQVGMPWLWGKIQTRFASRKGLGAEKLGYPVGSFGEIFDELSRQIQERGGEIHVGIGVDKILLEDGRATGVSFREDHGMADRQFDAVIATTPSYILPRLVPSLPDDYTRQLNNVNYLSAVLLILELDRPLSDFYWLNVADMDVPFVGIIEHTNLISSELYGGRHVVYIANYLSRESYLYGLEQDDLLAEYAPYLKMVNSSFDSSWIQQVHHHRVDAAQPVIPPNFSDKILPHRTPVRDLYLANTTQVYPEDRGTNYSVRLGRKVIRMLLEDKGFPITGTLPIPPIPSSFTVSGDL